MSIIHCDSSFLEDVIGTRDAVYWSLDAKHMVYAAFDDTGVPLAEYSLYGSDRDVYNTMYRAAYPKVNYGPLYLHLKGE